MKCLVTAGPTYEPLDTVRRLTNFSTGQLGTELAGYLVDRGHEVCLLLGELAVYRGACRAQITDRFSTTADLFGHMQALSNDGFDAVFHAAAVSDFAFAAVWHELPDGTRIAVKAGKIPTRDGTLLAELRPTPKIISQLRGWFGTAWLVGWKYEVDGDRAGVMGLAARQINECRTDACVANGPAYGPGFGLVTAAGDNLDLPDKPALFAALERGLLRGAGA